MELQPGAIIERYVVEEELGRGGMAVVYRVRHATLGSHHALKLLSLTSRSLRQRLVQEGQVQARLRHPNIVAVTDVLDVEGQPGLLMELVDGPTLEDWLLTHRPAYEQSERLFRGVLSAVEAAHEADLVHRDLKPANVLLAPFSGELLPKVTDFGLAKALAEASSSPGTRSGVSMGTPKYMAPEQIRDAGGVDKRADLFSLGALLYELVTGEPPFDGPDVLSVFNRVATGSFAPLPADVPEPLRRAIIGCLQVDPRARIGDCATLRAVLDGQLDAWDDGGARSAGAVSQTMVPGSFSDDSSDTWSPELASAQAAAGGGVQAVRSEPSLQTSTPSSRSVVTAPSETLVPDASHPDGSLDTGASQPPRRRGGLAWLLTGGGIALIGGVSVVIGLIIAVVGGWYGLSSWHAQRVQAILARHTGGEVQVAEVVVRPSQVLVRDLVVTGRDGEPVARAPKVRVVGQSWWFVLGMDELDDVVFEGLTVDLRQDDQGWVLPEQTLSFLQGRGRGDAFEGVDVQIHDARLVARGARGHLNARLDTLDFNELRLDAAGWRADDVRLAGLFVDGTQPIGSVVEITAQGGEARVRGLELYVRSRRDGRLDLPPVLSDGVPSYLGGDLPEGGASWFSDLADSMPVGVDAVRVESGEVHLVDTAHASRDVTWTLELDQAAALREAGSWRVTGLGTLAQGGRTTLDGGIDPEGHLEARLDLRDVPLTAFSSYLDGELAERKVKVAGGRGQGVFELEEQGSALGWQGMVELDDVVLEPLSDASRLSLRERRLLRPREEVTLTVDGLGVLSDPDYQPVEDVRIAVIEALLEPGGRVRARRRAYPAADAPVAASEEEVEEEQEDDVAVLEGNRGTTDVEEAPHESPTGVPKAPDRGEVEVPETMREAWRRRREQGREKLEEWLGTGRQRRGGGGNR